MDASDAKTELLINHFTHSLQQLVNHYADGGNYDGLQDIIHLVSTLVNDAAARVPHSKSLKQKNQYEELGGYCCGGSTSYREPIIINEEDLLKIMDQVGSKSPHRRR